MAPHREPERNARVLLHKLHELPGVAGVVQEGATILYVHALRTKTPSHAPHFLMKNYRICQSARNFTSKLPGKIQHGQACCHLSSGEWEGEPIKKRTGMTVRPQPCGGA